MAFSKGKRIEDETSARIIDLAVNIGCKEGPDALTVTRICKELNCDRRVIYNRFRDVDEIAMFVANRCNTELLKSAKAAMSEDASYFDNFNTFIQAIFDYIYERNAYFQHYTACFQVVDERIENEILNDVMELIEQGKLSGDVKADADSKAAAEDIWFMLVGIASILTNKANYRYQEGKKTMMYGVQAICAALKA
ncbi:MAG: TetR/AcrR family transcriptional regulator [Lachnospiraceae bacterium]|nr:TetR/AcrR family transcriptional regulator [Lachnospiraceae bacterium]